MIASVKMKITCWQILSSKTDPDVCNISDGALCNNSLQLKAVNFCYKNLILDTSRGLDPTIVKYDFPITVTGCLPHKLLLNWIRFLPNENRLSKYHCNQGNPGPLHWSKMELFVTFFDRWKRLTPFGLSSSPKFNQNFNESM